VPDNVDDGSQKAQQDSYDLDWSSLPGLCNFFVSLIHIAVALF
jgi:hypothetical protein